MAKENTAQKLIASNKTARLNYDIGDTFIVINNQK